MAVDSHRVTVGLPRMLKEAGELRDFLPPLVAALARAQAAVAVETGLGSGMGLADRDYLDVSPHVRAVGHEEAYRQDLVLVLRCPTEAEMALMVPGATLVSMLHFPTRAERVRRLVRLGLDAISLDCIADDHGWRLVEDAHAVAWNGLEAAFDAMEATHPRMVRPSADPVRVTLMGAGAIGRHAVEAATKYGRVERAERFARMGLPGVEVTTIGRGLTCMASYMRRRLRITDLLVDATQRHDPGVALVPNEWIGLLPDHAVVCDLVVDAYQPEAEPPTVRGIEGIPEGNLDRFVFGPDDPAWEATVPQDVPTANRRTVVSCYSWPGIHPLECMELYGSQLRPLMETLAAAGGPAGLRPDGSFFERALLRARLAAWSASPTTLGIGPEGARSGSAPSRPMGAVPAGPSALMTLRTGSYLRSESVRRSR